MTSLTTQKIILIVVDVIAVVLAGYLYVGLIGSGYKKSTMWGVYIGLIACILTGLISLYQADNKPKNIVMITSIVYLAYSLIIAGITIKENDYRPFLLQVTVAILALASINIAVFKPNDAKVFNSVNILATVCGLVIVGFGLMEDHLSHAKVYSLLGAILIALASITSSLSVLGIGM